MIFVKDGAAFPVLLLKRTVLSNEDMYQGESEPQEWCPLLCVISDPVMKHGTSPVECLSAVMLPSAYSRLSIGCRVVLNLLLSPGITSTTKAGKLRIQAALRARPCVVTSRLAFLWDTVGFAATVHNDL